MADRISLLFRSCARWTKRSFFGPVARQSYSGMKVGAFIDEQLIGLLGIRPVHTLARGAFLHVDDLIVAGSHRGSGAGRALMDYAEADARARNFNWVFLDAKPDAVKFYERRDYILHPAPSSMFPTPVLPLAGTPLSQALPPSTLEQPVERLS
jgi:GNAT superfamily N-acetyltransferase